MTERVGSGDKVRDSSFVVHASSCHVEICGPCKDSRWDTGGTEYDWGLYISILALKGDGELMEFWVWIEIAVALARHMDTTP